MKDKKHLLMNISEIYQTLDKSMFLCGFKNNGEKNENAQISKKIISPIL